MIMLCEPICQGFEHATFNAALLYTVLLAYPEAQVVFLGESEHLEWVRNILAKKDGHGEQRITWQELTIPPRLIFGWRRLVYELDWIRDLLQKTTAYNVEVVILCSTTNTAALVLNMLLRRHNAPPSVLAVLHSFLRSIVTRQSRRPWEWLLNLRLVLMLPHPRRLRYLVLGESIYQSVVAFRPGWAEHFQYLDLPYLWSESTLSVEAEDIPPVRFGYFGSNTQGFDVFVSLASDILAETNQAEFVLVGHLLNKPTDDLRRKIVGLSFKPLSPEEYTQRAKTLTYAVWTADPERYRWVASASFLDAMSYVKPGIYLRNPYIEYYFGKMGDIGYLCDTYEEMQDVIRSILREFPLGRYRQQCENIRRGRHIFEPQALAPRLRAIVAAGK